MKCHWLNSVIARMHAYTNTHICRNTYTRIYTSTDELLKREAATVYLSSRYAKWIVDDSRSRADRDRRSLQNLTDDRATKSAIHRRGKSPSSKSNQTRKSLRIRFSRGRFQVIIDHCRQSFRENVSKSAAPSGARKRTRTERNCDTIV